ncbi:hypothetical protein A7U60_g8697 [Sanghuangporus baumii]|uniref:Extracellular membrane protein CFEM domain-containing protein n=1 Tax=Sanghuangporus baumii TaxID=108892 RepID=A0A9Q5HQA7_SANBA|nr:hypothetical protein A7U60_g8697 [Sanghuangporus baumii]
MKLFTAQLFVLASSLTSFALSIRTGSIPQSLADACPSAHVVSSSTIIVDGQDIVRQVFSCPDGNLTVPAIPEANLIPSSNIAQRSVIEARSAAECTTPAAECQCGQAVICDCFGDTVAQTAADCTALIGSLPVISSIAGPTFIVQPGTVHTTSLRTCSVSFTNLGSTPEEFCWDDLATQANSEIACINQRNEATCVAETQRFVIHMGVAV